GGAVDIHAAAVTIRVGDQVIRIRVAAADHEPVNARIGVRIQTQHGVSVIPAVGPCGCVITFQIATQHGQVHAPVARLQGGHPAGEAAVQGHIVNAIGGLEGGPARVAGTVYTPGHPDGV